jgi:hypothetical protein
MARMEFSDVLMGAWYSPEELGAEVDADGKVIRLPQGNEAVAAFESLMSRPPEHTGDDSVGREPDEIQSPRPPEQSIRDGEELSGQLRPDDPTVVDVKAEPVIPPTREELQAELEEQARVLAGGSIPRHTARAVAAYKANPEQWNYDQLIEFVQGRRQSYFRHIEEHPDLAPATPEPWKAAAITEDTADATDAAEEEALDAADASEVPVAPADEPAPEGTEPADDPAPEGTEPADEPDTPTDAEGRAIEDPPDGMDTLV